MSFALDVINRLERSHKGLIHYAANVCQHVATYQRFNLPSIVLIEPLDGAFARLKNDVAGNPAMHAVRGLCSSLAGAESPFYFASNAGISSSMLKPRRHLIEAPSVEFRLIDKVVTTTLDIIIADLQASGVGFSCSQTDILVVEAQGAELSVLMGAARTLRRARHVYASIFTGGLFDKETDFDNLQSFMRCFGFRLNNVDITRHGWGSALFLR